MSDIDVIQVQNNLFPNDPWKIDDLDKLNSDIFILYDTDIPMGMFCLKPLTGSVSYLASFGIVSPYRRQGFGKMLYKYVKSFAQLTNHDILLDSDINEEYVTSFYTNVGAKLIETTKTSNLWIIKSNYK
jgi:GNAT superfamily N-acetyltransferase